MYITIKIKDKPIQKYPYLRVGFNKHCFLNFDSVFGNFSFVTKSEKGRNT